MRDIPTTKANKNHRAEYTVDPDNSANAKQTANASAVWPEGKLS